MKKLLILSAFTMLVVSCSSSIDGEEAATAQKSFTVDHINDLEIGCNCNVILIPGNEIGVKVESHQNIIDNLKVEAKNGSLVIGESKNVGQYSAYDVFVYVTRDLKDITLLNQTNLKVSGTLNVDDLQLETKNQTKVDEAYLITNNFKLSVYDQSSVKLNGTSVSLIYKGANQSNADLSTLETNDAQVYTSDNAILNINSRNSLAGSAKGNSMITYLGEPKKDTKVSDNAQVLKK